MAAAVVRGEDTLIIGMFSPMGPIWTVLFVVVELGSGQSIGRGIPTMLERVEKGKQIQQSLSPFFDTLRHRL